MHSLWVFITDIITTKMKATISLFILLFFSVVSYSQMNNAATNCAVKMKSISGMKMTAPVSLTDTTEKIMGDAAVSGYQFAYVGKSKKPFVQMKAENRTGTSAMTLDSTSELNYLQTLTGETTSVTNQLIRLSYNGFKIFGVVRNPETTNGIIESFIMAPNNAEILFFDFYSLQPGAAGFQDVNYQSARNSFLGEYTDKLNQCVNR